MKRPKNPNSERLIALRGSIGVTQPQFAEILGTSAITIARYETSSPPSGLTLLKLGAIADKHGRPDLAAGFRSAFWREVSQYVGRVEGYTTYQFSNQQGDRGYIFETLTTGEEYAYALAFQHGLSTIRKGGRDASRARKALRTMFDALIPDDERWTGPQN
jgi:transcriptional regulator with XRE-family HTH domain